MNPNVQLHDSRLLSAQLSKGTSGSGVRRLAMALVEELAGPRDLLDFGCGTGDLLRDLHERSWFKSLAGIDIVSRPAELPDEIVWLSHDLNEPLSWDRRFDVVLATEVIEHLENPRAMLRQLRELVRPGGYVILTTPNQESWRSVVSLVFDGHFAAFRGKSYPAHITALLGLDLKRIATEAGWIDIRLVPSDSGAIPKLTRITWQSVSFGLLRGKRWSDNLALVAKAPPLD